MNEYSNSGMDNSEFSKIMKNHSDEELIKILKMRNLYQKEAAAEAVREAILRGLINSEQDLFSDKFRPEERKFSLFPAVENDYFRTKFTKSVIRIIMFSGFIPVVWSAFAIQNEELVKGIATLIFGVAWITVSYLLFKNLKPQLLLVLTVLIIIALAFVIRNLIENQSTVFINYLIPVFLGGLILYGLGYLNKLRK